MDNTKNTHMRFSLIFDKWQDEYLDDPESFLSFPKDKDGNKLPMEDYGDLCASYFMAIAADLDSKGLLPQIINKNICQHY